MNALRKLMFKPKKNDGTLLSQFFYADEELNLITDELDSFDGHKEPERCTQLVNKLRSSQDKLLIIVDDILRLELGEEFSTSRDFRVKFPDDVLQEGLRGQLWFGAECLAAGSSILNREPESNCMRPLAKAMTQKLGLLRKKLREQCLKNGTLITDRIQEDLILFDRLFADFELSYVSAMVHIKSMKEYDILQDVIILFSETTQRALKQKLLTQDMLDDYDPALMFTIPRLAIICGLLIHSEGPLNPDMDPIDMSEMFRPFQTLLYKIRELLWTLSDEELSILEKSLCSTEEPVLIQRSMSTSSQTTESNAPPSSLTPAQSDGTPVPDTIVPGDTMVHSSSNITVVSFNCDITNLEKDLTGDTSDAKDGNINHQDSGDSGVQCDECSSGVPTGAAAGPCLHQTADTLDEEGVTCLRHSKSWPEACASTKTPTNSGNATTSSRSSSACTICVTDCVCNVGTTPSGHAPSDHTPSQGTMPPPLVLPYQGHHIPAAHTSPTALQSRSLVDEDDASSGSDEESVQYVTDYLNDLFLTEDNAARGSSTKYCQTEQQDAMRTSNSADNIPPPCDDSSTINSTDRENNLQNRSFEIHSESELITDGICNENTRTNNNSKKEINDSTVVPHKKKDNATDMCDCDIRKIMKMAPADVTGTEPNVRRSRSGLNGEPVTLLTAAGSVVTGRETNQQGSQHEWDKDSFVSSATSSYASDSHDDEEIALAIQAAELAARKEARSRYKNSTDLMHRLFVCVSGVADQLQTNYAADFRHILKVVFECNASQMIEDDDADSVHSNHGNHSDDDAGHNSDDGIETQPTPEARPGQAQRAPSWVPDEDVLHCSACKAPFTFVRRRHHCRNCGKIFCHRCSSNYVSLPHYGHDKPVRVCMHCYTFEVTPFT